MAGLCGLKIVLLWAGIISLTNSSRSPQCFYTVTATRFGFQLNITSSITGTSYISLNEEGRPETTTQFTVHHFGQTSSHSFSHQKPCTAYDHTVTLTDGSGGETLCDPGDDKTLVTNKMDEDDIKRASCIDGSVCYHSDWDISSSLQTSNKNPPESCRSDNKTFCIKPDFNHICSDLTTTFTSGNCADSSFSITTSIPIDFLDPNEIKQKPQNQLPAKINTEFPPNCDGLSVDYTCQEKEKPNESKKLSELEPFTDYSCTGQVNNNNVTIANTTAVDVLINCDIEIKLIKNKQEVTNTSIDLSWITTSLNCQNVLPTLEKLSYDCSCSPTASKWKDGVTGELKKLPAAGSCHITGLEPFTDYICDIQPAYNKENFAFRFEVKMKTETGKPEDIHKLTVAVPENNVIKVTCDYREKFNGPEGKFITRLYDGSGTMKTSEQTKCNFEFKDLNDSATYTVEVTAFNGEFESNPKIQHVTTSYNDSFIIRLFFYMAFIIYVVLNAVIYKIYVWRLRKSINVVNEDVMLESTAGHENDPQSECR